MKTTSALVGIPPLAGFVGKYYLFSAAIQQGYIWLVVVAILTSVVSLYYYLGVVRQMYFQTSTEENPVTASGVLKTALIICVIGVLLLGIYPNIILDFAQQAAMVALREISSFPIISQVRRRPYPLVLPPGSIALNLLV